MNNEEIKFWIARWKRLPPNDRRNMVIKIWERLIKYKI
jgi:tRNA splicing endonuclease